MPTSMAPSITLQITKSDAERFLEACNAVDDSFKNVLAESSKAKTETEETGDVSNDTPLHERLYEAAQDSSEGLVMAYLDRIRSAGLSMLEVRASVLLFSTLDKSTKLRYFFQALGDPENQSVKRDGAVSLFRSILTGLSCCLHPPEPSLEKKVIVEGQVEAESDSSPDGSDRPTKRVKREDENEDFRSCCQSPPSFDSSVAPLRDEEDPPPMRHEIQEVATFAADALFKNGEVDTVSFSTFGEWYNSDGAKIVPWLELLSLSKWHPSPSAEKDEPDAIHEEESPCSLKTDDGSPVLISFDFSGSDSPSSLFISISEANLYALRHLVHRTGLLVRPAADLCKTLLKMAQSRTNNDVTVLTLDKEGFQQAISSFISQETMKKWSEVEREAFDLSFMAFYSCYQVGPSRSADQVNLKELAIGSCFFCAGNKSAKLAMGFELLDDKNLGYLTEDQLLLFLRSYLLALVALSFLLPVAKQTDLQAMLAQRRQGIRTAVESGAKWTLGHFLSHLSSSVRAKGQFPFETFATWYSTGGYNVAPWLELLDLNKVLSLINAPPAPIPLPVYPETVQSKPISSDRVSSLRRHHSNRRRGPLPEILFSFPLANRQSLIVLKDDATYVREVVEQLGLLCMTPSELWSSLSKAVAKRRRSKKDEVAVYVDSTTFVDCMQEICPRACRKRSSTFATPVHSKHSIPELLSNFFQCFNINQTNSVALDELMGGLALLCGGKKSLKLAFAFSIFDTRPGSKRKEIAHSLSGEDLFLFLRSILIVTFSCCSQSLDMTDDIVGRCIADTANMICNDVMRHQWETLQSDRLTFDEFGGWYNEGGFERAPWLELLDLHKWVLVDDFNALKKQAPGAGLGTAATDLVHPAPSVPPPPPEDAFDSSFFDDNAIMGMDSMDEMDMILMQQPSTDEGISPRISKAFSFSPRHHRTPASVNSAQPPETSPLKFHLYTDDMHGGYMLSLSQARISHFKQILEDSGIHSASIETTCNTILSKADRGNKGVDDPRISKQAFDSAVRSITKWNRSATTKSRQTLLRVCNEIYDAFSACARDKPSVTAIACGFTVLSCGKKSDKLENAFEVLDRTKKGRFTKTDMTKYLQSFLTVLLTIAFSPSLASDPVLESLMKMDGEPNDRSPASVARVVKAGAEWATSLAFRDFGADESDDETVAMSFDDFAEWYTSKGFNDIPWLELIDLRKWVMVV